MSADDPKDRVVMGRADEIGETQDRWKDAGQVLPPAKSRWRASPEDAARASAEIAAIAPAGARKRVALDERTPPLVRRLQLASGLLAIAGVVAFAATAFHDAARPDHRIVRLPGAVEPAAPPTFYLSVDTQPSAEIRVDGEARGSTPAMLSTSCRSGDLIEVELSRRGYLSYTITLLCEPGKTSRIARKLERP